ncbi:MAG: hypothetical protein RBJ76_08395 [Stenomitos frigidus ULC029]
MCGLGSYVRLFLPTLARSELGRVDATLNPVIKKMASAGADLGGASLKLSQVIFELGRAIFLPG